MSIDILVPQVYDISNNNNNNNNELLTDRGDVTRWLQSEFNSEDPGFDPLVGQGKEQFFCPSKSALVQTCLCLIPLHA